MLKSQFSPRGVQHKSLNRTVVIVVSTYKSYTPGREFKDGMFHSFDLISPTRCPLNVNTAVTD